jgi:hypothetical protein
VNQGLLSVRTFVIPGSILIETIRFLRAVGAQGYEGFVLWGGVSNTSAEFRFKSFIIPAQNASVTDDGLLVTVGGDALFQVNKALYERGEILAAQVHSHPTDAYHSSTDDQFPLATLLGSLSVVIPNFAREAPMDFDSWAFYRLTGPGKWDSASDETELVIE